MKYFIIEIQKPYDGEGAKEPYRELLQNKITNCEFEVVEVCASHEKAIKEIVKFQLKNIKNQSGLHYEIIQGEGEEGYKGLQKEMADFYKRVSL